MTDFDTHVDPGHIVELLHEFNTNFQKNLLIEVNNIK